MPKAQLKLAPRKVPVSPIKLDLGYPDLKKLMSFPWPWADESVEEFKCADVLHYVPARQRGQFMDELYRVLTPEGQATIIVAYYSTVLAYADYMLEWPPMCEQSFLYFNKEWREQNKVPHPLKANFSYTYGFILPADVSSRAQESQSFYVKHYLNTVTRLQVVMTKADTKKVN